MAFFGNYNPASFGWTAGGATVPFTYRGVSFPSGVSAEPGVAAIFTRVLDALVPHIPGGLVAGQCWGDAKRAKRTDPSSLSFHDYGIAIDINAPENPQTRTHSFGRPDELPANTGTIVKAFGMEWGGNWTPDTPPDFMHIELHLSPAEVRSQAALRIHSAAPAPAGSAAGYSAWQDVPAGKRTVEQGCQGSDVTALQKVLNAWYPTITPQLARDGQYGPATTSRVKYFQTRARISVDGVCGPVTWKALGF